MHLGLVASTLAKGTEIVRSLITLDSGMMHQGLLTYILIIAQRISSQS